VSGFARARRALRGPHLAIFAVLVMFGLDYLTYRNIWHVAGVPLKWPIETWQMYASKASTRREVHYRRFLIHKRDGAIEPSSVGQIDFLEHAYRIDVGMARNLPELMEIVLRELARQDADVVGFTYETRTWAYRKLTLDEFLTKHGADYAYTARLIADRPAVAADPANLLHNGNFEAFDPGSGIPKQWFCPASMLFYGFGLDPRGDHAFRFGDPPDHGAQVLRQAVQLPAVDGHRTVRVHARALASRAGAYLEVHVGMPENRGANASSPPHLGDGTWQDVSTSLEVPSEAVTVTVVVHGVPDTMFDDVVLTTER
jgi:hypothetical protein